MRKLRGNFFVNSYVKAKFLTHDPARIASYESDPLITRPISVNILLGLYEAAERVVADAAAITLPTQLLISGQRLGGAPSRRSTASSSAWRIARKERHVLPGFFHDTLGERDRKLATVSRSRRLHPRPVRSTRRTTLSLRDAHRVGFTADESRVLAAPLPWYTPRGAYWALTRMSRSSWAACCRAASRWATPPASIRAARSTTCTATRRRARR